MSYFDIEKNLELAINDGQAIQIVSFRLNDDVEQQLQRVLNGLLDKYQRSALQHSLFSCIIELATNATKANMKHLVFQEEQLDMNNAEAYASGMKVFRDRIHDRHWLENYAAKAQDQGLLVRIVFNHTVDGMSIEIINNMPILPQDEERIRQKFEQAMQFDSLHEYYLANADSTEGEGIGFALNLLLLKGENLDVNLFRIGGADGTTIARIEVPFTDRYVSHRPLRVDDPSSLRRPRPENPGG